MDVNLIYTGYILVVVVILSLMFRGGGKGAPPNTPRFGT